MNDVKLGQIIVGEAFRDAVHVAVAPIVAPVDVYPGQRVNEDGQPDVLGVGIVDPFLTRRVLKGERFYLCLDPGTIRSLRHDWSHPAFLGAPPTTTAIQASDRAAESERWLRKYAAEQNNYDDPEAGFQRLIQGLRAGEWSSHGYHSVTSVDDVVESDDLRRHAETYLGIRIDWNNFTFRCAC